MKADLYIALVDRLNEIIGGELAWLDWDWGQLELPTENYPLQFDAVLISFPDVQWQDGGKKVQYGDQIIQVRTAIDVYSDLHTADEVKAPDRNYAIEKMKLASRVFAVLQGFSGEFFTPLKRISGGEEKRDDGLKVFVDLYITNITDTSAAKKWQDADASLKLTKQVVQEIN